MSTEAILRERGNSHGDFTDVAAMEQNLIMTMEAGVRWNELTAVQRCSLRMIQHKISRILSGNPDHADHWDDIQGYAKIARDRLKLPGSEPVHMSVNERREKLGLQPIETSLDAIAQLAARAKPVPSPTHSDVAQDLTRGLDGIDFDHSHGR